MPGRWGGGLGAGLAGGARAVPRSAERSHRRAGARRPRGRGLDRGKCMNVRPDPGLVMIVAGVTGIVTSVTMIGPLLVDISRDLGVSLGQAGLLAAAAGVPQALFSPFSGLLSDRLGRKPMIVAAFVGVALLSVGAPPAPPLPAFVRVPFPAGPLPSP